jgi:hypothetical protein
LVGVDTKRFYWGGHVATCLLLYIMEDETGVDALLAKVFSVFLFCSPLPFFSRWAGFGDT